MIGLGSDKNKYFCKKVCDKPLVISMQDSLQGSSPPRLSKSGGREPDLGPKTFQCQGKADVGTILDRILLKPFLSFQSGKNLKG